MLGPKVMKTLSLTETTFAFFFKLRSVKETLLQLLL